MGLNQTFNYLSGLVFLVLLFSFSSSAAVPSSPRKIRPYNAPSNVPATDRLFYIKNNPPFFVNKGIGDKKRKRKRKKTGKSFRTRPFSAMLPRGYVPPSGSSPCHNDYPAFYCSLSTQKP